MGGKGGGAVLEAVNLAKSFEGRPVISGFSQRFEAGGHYGLMGPSGCGKTTLLNMLMGLIPPDRGEVRGMKGLRFSAVFQEDRLLEQLPALGNVRLVSDAPRKEVEALLLQLGLAPDNWRKPVGEYSGGMKRRVALCRALMAEYDLLFLDEPFKGLDEETRAQVMATLWERTKGKTLVLVTHDPWEAQGLNRIILPPASAE